MESYITITRQTCGEYSEKRSRFIGILSPVKTEAEAAELIAKTKAEYFDARHTAYAYVLSDGTSKFSDDGEPHGTAGKPMLDLLLGSEIKNAVVTVTRYFGGVLLGTGGLVRAYSAAAKEAINKAEPLKMCKTSVLSVSCDYTFHSSLLRLIEDIGGEVEDTVFTDKIMVVFRIKSEDFDRFNLELCEKFSSKLKANEEKQEFFPFRTKK